ncbi:dimer_Tnp_hAT domain-containing protein [Trichonephila clavipes]|nr:dimer_Tnp_hAT domain-containing protein [Trichonephila clavipes]
MLHCNLVQNLKLCQSYVSSCRQKTDLPSAMELSKDCKDFFKDLRSDTTFNEMPCDARELDTPQNDELKYCKDLETVLTDGNTPDINALDLADEIVAVLALLNKKESPIEILKFISNLDFTPTLGTVLRIFLTLPISVEIEERNFSKLKLIKNFFRSTTTEDRLNGLTIAIEYELAEESNVKETVKKILRIKRQLETVNNSTSTGKTSRVLLVSDGKEAVSYSKACCAICGMESTGAYLSDTQYVEIR